MSKDPTDTAGKDLIVRGSVIDVRRLLEDVQQVALMLGSETPWDSMRAIEAVAGVVAVMSIEAEIDEETTLNFVRDIYRAIDSVAKGPVADG